MAAQRKFRIVEQFRRAGAAFEQRFPPGEIALTKFDLVPRVPDQGLFALQVRLDFGQARLRLGQLGLPFGYRDPVVERIDLDQQIAFSDDAAIGEGRGDADDPAGDQGPQLDIAPGDDIAVEHQPRHDRGLGRRDGVDEINLLRHRLANDLRPGGHHILEGQERAAEDGHRAGRLEQQEDTAAERAEKTALARPGRGGRPAISRRLSRTVFSLSFGSHERRLS